VEQDGSRRLVSYQRVPDYPVFVAYNMDEGVIRSAWQGYLLQWGMLALVAAGWLSGLAWLAITRARRENIALQQWVAIYEVLAREVGRREQAEAALVQTQKLEALGQLTGGIAHDFKNLLHVLAGNLARPKSRISDERPRFALASCEIAIEKGEKLLAHLLAFARRQPLQHEVCDVHDCLRNMEDVLRQAADGQVLRTELSDELWPVMADPTQLELAVLNLVLNARDSMPDGGTIRVSTGNRSLSDGKRSLRASLCRAPSATMGWVFRPTF